MWYSPKHRIDPSEVQASRAGSSELNAADATISRVGDDFEVGSFGDDAGFVSNRSPLTNWFGVADGVGGWRKHGVNPAEFAFALMDRTCMVAQRFNEDGAGAAVVGAAGEGGDDHVNLPIEKMLVADLQDALNERALSTKGKKPELQARLEAAVASEDKPPDGGWSAPGMALARGFDAVVHSGEISAGSSTACVAAVDTQTGILSTANLGDSGFLLVRRGEIVEWSEERRHSFWTPLQLTIAPPGHPAFDDRPNEADLKTHKLNHGDLVILATDGLTDNMDHDELLSVIQKCGGEASSAEIAKQIVRTAARLMQKSDRLSPFAARATEEGFCILGGKMDDITVCVAKIKRTAM
eukprot:gene1257-28481_t